jgi:catechol 2,3-dioxygenase-like lactoylglutathione lyase family enzyme
MVKTYGLTHIALKVKDIHRSSSFYQKIFGAKEMYKQDDFIQIQTPNSRDIIVFEKGNPTFGENENIIHFGFRLESPDDVDQAIHEVKEAGGKIKEHGEFVPGEPYLFFYDPDGYEIEVWYEKIPTSLNNFQ